MEIISDCNLSCKYCYNAQSHNQSIISITNFKKAVNIFIKAGIKQLSISGGDPLLHPNLIEMVEYAHKKGLVVHLCTNGYILDDNTAKKLASVGLSQIQINIDSHMPSIHDKLRGKAHAFKKATEAINLCKKYKITTVVVTVVTKSNIDDLIDISILAHDVLKADRYRVIDYISNGLNTKLDISVDDYLNATSEVINHSIKNFKTKNVISYEPLFNQNSDNFFHIPCPISKSYAINIKPNGDVVFCACNSKLTKPLFNIFTADNIEKSHKQSVRNLKFTKSNCPARDYKNNHIKNIIL